MSAVIGPHDASGQGSQNRVPSGAQPSLRPYQVAAIAAIRSELLLHRATLLVAATGTGKTVTFAELARMEVSHGNRVLILVHRDELIGQARRKCEALGLWPDVEKGKSRANTLAKVVIASVQTLRGARLARWARSHFALIIVDEAHHAVAAGYRAVLDHFEAKVVGVTATPDRADGIGLIEVFESVAYRYEIRQAIAEGYLVRIVARRVVVDAVDLSSVAMRAGDFAQDQLAAIMTEERAIRGVVVPLLELAQDRLTIGFCVDVAHAHAVAAMLNQYRPGCARAVSGKTSDDERERLLEGHARGDFQFLLNCDLLVEGYDCPAVSCIAMIRPTKSRGRFVQAAGRGLRPAPGKVDCLILDMTGRPSKHRLVGPADCLVGNDNVQLADDERDEIDRLIGAAQLSIEAVIDQARDEVARRREAMQLTAVVKYRAESIDPFIGAEDPAAIPPYAHGWNADPASAAQLKALDDLGVTISKLPRVFSRGDAWRLLAQLKARMKNGLCSYKMARRLASLGVVDTRTLTRERANELRDLCLQRGWHPKTLASQPETQQRDRSEVFA